MKIDPGDYRKPDEEAIRAKLSSLQYRVTRENDTEKPFDNEYWDFFEEGIYVDIVTGEPLFTSMQKYESSCGWPSFFEPIEAPVIVEREDIASAPLEVRSRGRDSHLATCSK